jgi:hypothetical protein
MLPLSKLRELEDNNPGATGRILKKSFKDQFINWAGSSRVANKHSLARELLYQFMVKYNTVLTETDVKDLKREVKTYKGMSEVFAKGWLSPQSEVNV